MHLFYFCISIVLLEYVSELTFKCKNIVWLIKLYSFSLLNKGPYRNLQKMFWNTYLMLLSKVVKNCNTDMKSTVLMTQGKNFTHKRDWPSHLLHFSRWPITHLPHIPWQQEHVNYNWLLVYFWASTKMAFKSSLTSLHFSCKN